MSQQRLDARVAYPWNYGFQRKHRKDIPPDRSLPGVRPPLTTPSKGRPAPAGLHCGRADLRSKAQPQPLSRPEGSLLALPGTLPEVLKIARGFRGERFPHRKRNNSAHLQPCL